MQYQEKWIYYFSLRVTLEFKDMIKHEADKEHASNKNVHDNRENKMVLDPYEAFHNSIQSLALPLPSTGHFFRSPPFLSC